MAPWGSSYENTIREAVCVVKGLTKRGFWWRMAADMRPTRIGGTSMSDRVDKLIAISVMVIVVVGACVFGLSTKKNNDLVEQLCGKHETKRIDNIERIFSRRRGEYSFFVSLSTPYGEDGEVYEYTVYSPRILIFKDGPALSWAEIPVHPDCAISPTNPRDGMHAVLHIRNLRIISTSEMPVNPKDDH